MDALITHNSIVQYGDTFLFTGGHEFYRNKLYIFHLYPSQSFEEMGAREMRVGLRPALAVLPAEFVVCGYGATTTTTTTTATTTTTTTTTTSTTYKSVHLFDI